MPKYLAHLNNKAITTMKVLIIGSQAKSLINFRGPLIEEIVRKNHQVIAMAPIDEDYQRVSLWLSERGVELKPYFIQRNGLSIFGDLRTYFDLKKQFNEISPDKVLSYFIKPNIWGGLAFRKNRTSSFYSLIEGLGIIFNENNKERKTLPAIRKLIISQLYKISMKKAKKVIFLNSDDINEFVSQQLLPIEKVEHINGIGLDLDYFSYQPMPLGELKFIMIGRLLKSKGFFEYIEAAKVVKKLYPEIIFNILGPKDTSPDAIPISEIEKHHNSGLINYLGETNDVRPHIANSHIFVLPSYYGEGLPRTIMEAMSIGRPILTTQNVGCRETVENGKNGFLVPKYDVNSLAERMIWFIENNHLIENMGLHSRKMAVEKYDVNKINKEIMDIMEL